MSPIEVQIYTLLAMVIVGGVMGVTLDMYRAFRKAFKLGRFSTAICDLIYWLLAAVLGFYILVIVNWGEVRLYSFLGLISGFLVYYYLASPSLYFSFTHGFKRARKCLVAISSLASKFHHER